MRKLINKLFKMLGYVPISSLGLPINGTITTTTIPFELVRCRVSVANERAGRNKNEIEDCIKYMITKELAAFVTKHVTIDIIEEFDRDPYHTLYEGRIYISKCK